LGTWVKVRWDESSGAFASAAAELRCNDTGTRLFICTLRYSSAKVLPKCSVCPIHAPGSPSTAWRA